MGQSGAKEVGEKEEGSYRVWGNGGFEKGGKELTSLGHWRGFTKEEESGKSLDGRRLKKRRKGVERPCAKRGVLERRKEATHRRPANGNGPRVTLSFWPILARAGAHSRPDATDSCRVRIVQAERHEIEVRQRIWIESSLETDLSPGLRRQFSSVLE